MNKLTVLFNTPVHIAYHLSIYCLKCKTTNNIDIENKLEY